jgi:hypothetical protein
MITFAPNEPAAAFTPEGPDDALVSDMWPHLDHRGPKPKPGFTGTNGPRARARRCWALPASTTANTVRIVVMRDLERIGACDPGPFCLRAIG